MEHIRSEITTETKNKNLDYLIGSTFRNINKLLVCSFKIGQNYYTKSYFNRYYIPLLEIKDFNALIDDKPYLISQYKASKKQFKKISKCQEIMITKTGHLLYFSYY